MAKLTTAKRAALPKKSFALPKERAYPINDKAHARNALARVSQHGSSSEKAEVRAKVHKKFPEIGDNRKGRLKNIKTDRGTFRMKANRKGE